LEDQISSSRHKVVGTKQTIKALEQGEVLQVFIAGDAEGKVIKPVINLCKKTNLEPQYVDTMGQLGKMFGIKVKAATAAILKD